MRMVKVLILEDEYLIRESLKKIAYGNHLVDMVIDTHHAKEAIRLAKEHKPDIILLDIGLEGEGLNGIEAAKRIDELNPGTYFVFITGHSEYVFESFQVHPYEYILKPFTEERVKKVISSLADRIAKGNNYITNQENIVIKTKDEICFIRQDDVIFAEKQDKYTLIHTKDNILKTDKTLNEFEERLGKNFFRVHKSFIVNFNKVKMIKEVSTRSYEIEFYGYDKNALMSRYKFEKYKDIFIPS